jgi:putative transposase
MHLQDKSPTLAELTEVQREQAMARFRVLRSHTERGVPLPRAAQAAGVGLRTVERWLAQYRADGLAGLVRRTREDRGHRKLPVEAVELIEGLFLKKPRPSAAAVYRRVLTLSKEQGWLAPSYSTVYAIIARLDPALTTLAHEGPARFRDKFELVHRHRASHPNAIWQADHTQLDVLIRDASGKPVRPWLTTVLDDHSRALAGYSVFVDAPSAFQTSLALRQAIWRKADPLWAVCGIPDVLYVDHGSDFTSKHLEQVAVDLHFEIVYSTIARPQGRGKIERLFGTLNTELLPELPGYLTHGKPVTEPKLSLAELDRTLGTFFVGSYNARTHREIRAVPQAAWSGDGWLPRMPNSLEELDLLLISVAKARTVHRDGIHFQGIRYMDPTLAAYVKEAVTIRYDPRDVAEIRVFHRNRFLCRAVSPEHSGQAITLKDIQAARSTHRRALRGQIRERVTPVADFLSPHVEITIPPLPEPSSAQPKKVKLRTYREDLE